MTHTNQSDRFLGLISVLFLCSGCAALIYEVVWFQLLQLVIGSSGVSLGLLLGAYMGGLCIGSIALPRMVSARHHPLAVYALLELGIGVLGIAILFAVPFAGRMYLAGPTEGLAGVVLRGAVCAVLLLPPTIMMGATLPAAARWLETTRIGIGRLGLFYAANTVGGVLGCLLAGFYLLRVYDLAAATYAAVAINVVVALIAFALARRAGYSMPDGKGSPSSLPRASGIGPVYAAIALSGLCALGAQVLWTRLLSFMLGVTVYTFSIILAVFLVGLGAGSAVGSYIARTTVRPRMALGVCQMCLAGALAWTAYFISNALPYWPVDPWLSVNPWFNFQVDVLRTLWAALPATLLWGASFPLALAAGASPEQDLRRLTGETYAANTAGAITGALLFSLILIPAIGTQRSQQLLIALSAISGVIVLIPLIRGRGAWKRATWLTASTAFAILLISTVSELPWQVIAFGHRIAPTLRAFELYPNTAVEPVYKGEGLNASIVITRSQTGDRSFHVSGKTEATSVLEDMRLQRMLGHIPALFHSKPRSVLSWGFGAGVTAGSFVVHPEIEKMVICELEPLVPPATTQYFGRENHNVLTDSRTRVVYDDARHFLLTTKDRFDIITADPLDPWAKGTAALYTKEFFELVRQHLNPGGVFGVFVQLYETNVEAVKSELATFFEVFPEATIWSNHLNGSGYDLVLLGQTDTIAVDVDELQSRLDRPDQSRVAESLREAGFRSAVELLATFIARASDLQPWLGGVEMNLDRNLRLQYLGGMGINSMSHDIIYKNLLGFRHFPEGFIVGSTTRVQILRSILNANDQAKISPAAN